MTSLCGRFGEQMSVKRKFILATLVFSMLLIAPVMGNPNGPPWMNGGAPIVETGCTCHGGGSPSTEVVISISSVPRTYNLSESYDMTITLSHASNEEGGFVLYAYDDGILTPGTGSQIVVDTNTNEEDEALSQSEPASEWTITWTAPDADLGPVAFQLVGNAVNGDGLPNEMDHWNILSFSIPGPSDAAIVAEDDISLRTISVGDYDSLFVAVEDPDALEAERQEGIAHDFFANGNLYYWTTLSLIIIGAVIQGEFYERKFGGGPLHLDMSLAIPQGIRRGVLSLLLIIVFAWSIDSSQSWGVTLVLGMIALWAIYGVYRTISQARAPKVYTDLI